MAFSKSMTSPTPYWSSKIMNIPPEILDDVLGTEADCYADNRRPGQERCEIHTDRVEDQQAA